MARKWKLMSRAYPKFPMLRSLELNKFLISGAIYGYMKGYVKKNYSQRFPNSVLSVLTNCVVQHSSVHNWISICCLPSVSIPLCISGRTRCLSTTLWPLTAENFTLAYNSLFFISTELYEVIAWNGNLLYIFLALNVYTAIWEEAVHGMGGCDYVHKWNQSRNGFGLLVSCHWLWLYFPKKQDHKTEEVLRRCWWLKLILWPFPFFLSITSAEANEFGDDSIKYDFRVGWISWK